MVNDEIKPKRRKPLLAAVLNLFGGGLGHLYVGKPARFWFCMLAYAGLFTLCGQTGLTSKYFLVWVLCWVAIVGMIIFVVVDAYRIAKVTPDYRMRWFNRWYVYCGYVIILNILWALAPIYLPDRATLFHYETYSISTDTMAPSVQKGEWVMVDPKANPPFKLGTLVAIKPFGNDITFIRRIAPGSDSSSVFVTVDHSETTEDSRKWGLLPVSRVVGPVTYIAYSHDLKRIGSTPQ